MLGSASRPRRGVFARRRAAGENVGTVRDPAHILLRSQGLRQMLRDGGESQRLAAAIAIMKMEMARMRGEWSPDDPSVWDGLEDGEHLTPWDEPTPAALEARKQPPPFTHYETAFGRPKPSRPRFSDDEPRPELEPQFGPVRVVDPAGWPTSAGLRSEPLPPGATHPDEPPAGPPRGRYPCGASSGKLAVPPVVPLPDSEPPAMRSLLPLAVLAVAGVAAAADKPAVVQSAKSGNWSAPDTWAGKKVPAAGDRVLIRAEHAVVYDASSKDVIRGITVSGKLAFAPDKDTRLEVGLIAVTAGDQYTEEGFDCEAHVMKAEAGKPVPTLEMGTMDTPIGKGKTALIRLHYVEGMNKESCPAIVCCGGRWDAHGQPMSRTWVKLGSPAKVGDTAVSLAEAVTGWNVGDKIVLTGTQTHGPAKTESVSEERVITAIDGTKLTFDGPLKHAHAGDGEYRGEVANLSRNVVVESADPAGVRGHTMYHRDSAGSLSFAEFRHLGKKNVLGRYALHYHLCADTMRGSSVTGVSVWDSDNRWLTIHGTNYLIVRDVVGYKSVGHGFFLEDGTEVYNVLDRNLAVLAAPGKRLPKQILPFDANDGAGFWWTCSLNTFTRNVAAECGQYGFRYEATPSSALKLDFPIRQPDGTKKKVDVRTLPFVRFEDNEVHSVHGLYGVNLGEGVNRVGPDSKHPFVVKNLKIWDTHYGFRPQVPNLLVENLHVDHVAYGVYHPNFDNHVYRNVYIGHTNTEPFNRGHDDLSVQYGVLTVDGLTFDGCRSGGMPLIQISDDNPTGNAVSHFRNVKTPNWTDGSKQKALANLGGGPRPTPKSEKGVPIYLHDHFGPGRHAMVVSMKSGEYKADPTSFRSEAPITGNESRVKEVKDIAFPELLQPVDDLPPTTVITRVVRKGDQLYIRGTTADNGKVVKVTVNGREAKATAPNFAEWEVFSSHVAPVELKLTATAEDAAGNVEKTPMVLVVK